MRLVLFAVSYTHLHMLHLEAASPEIKRWRKLLGYVVLPNVIQPMWAWEGYAMYAENHFGTQGRLSDTLYDMYLREMALGNHFEPSHLLGGYSYLDRWPGQKMCIRDRLPTEEQL